MNDQYQYFMEMTDYEVYLAFMDQIGVKVIPEVEHDPDDNSWADNL